MRLMCLCLLSVVHSRAERQRFDAASLIRHWGYPLESHNVTTADGYILGVLRIPSARQGKGNGPPVLLQHGLASSCVDWVDNMPNTSLGFLLADAGQDVWLSNSRGSSYSTGHVNLTQQDPAYWQFTWEQLAGEDLPAVVQYVLQTTGAGCVHYVGHSQGTLIAFAQLAVSPELNRQLCHVHALAPVASVRHIRSPVRHLAPVVSELQAVLDELGDYSLGDIDWLLDYVKPVCLHDRRWLDACENLMFFIAGAEPRAHLDQSMMGRFLWQHPDSTSIKNLVHFGQLVRSGGLRRYDYGRLGNLHRYGQTTPPSFNLSLIQVPVSLYQSSADEFAGDRDAAWLMQRLPHYRLRHYNTLSHLDFVISPLATPLVYDHILEHLATFY